MAMHDRAVKIMLARHNDLFDTCHWCGTVIVWWQKLPENAVLNKLKGGGPGRFVVFLLNGQKVQYPAATVDHVLEISNGGNNVPSNLVASCCKCNQQRSALPPQNKYPKCIQCGKKRVGPRAGRKRCGKCVDANREIALKAKGIWHVNYVAAHDP